MFGENNDKQDHVLLFSFTNRSTVFVMILQLVSELYIDGRLLFSSLKRRDIRRDKRKVILSHLYYALCGFQNLLDSIHECKGVINESIQQQVEHKKRIEWIKKSTDKFKEINRLATIRIEKYRPFEVYYI